METKQGGEMIIRTMGAKAACVEALVREVNTQARNHACCHHVRVYDEDILTITYNCDAPKILMDDILRRCVEELDESIYALENCTLEQQLVSLLKIRGGMLSVAESFTGGGIASRITSVSGASSVYFEGINSYNEVSKITRLGVSPQTLAKYGAVSEQTAYEMVAGLLRTGDCSLAIATTGLAGPNTDVSGLPVGLCYIAVGSMERVRVYQYHFEGTREEITKKAINYALFLACKQLKN